MAHILIVSARDDLQTALAARLGNDYEVLDASSTAEARIYADTISPDLVIADVSTDTDEWPNVRRELRELAAPYPLPFLFVAGPEHAATLGELVADGSVVAVSDPPGAELEQLITTLVSPLERKEGVFTDQSVDALFGTIASESASGVLTVYHSNVVKKLVFRDGHLTRCASTDPQDRVEQVFIRAGLLGEKQWLDAVAQTPDAEVEEILARLSVVSDEQFAEVMQQRARECLLDLYLWNTGKWVWREGEFGVPGATLRVDLESVRPEGIERARQWPFLVDLFLRNQVTFEVHSERYPPEKLSTADERRFYELATAGYTVRQIQMELRERDFAFCARCHDLLKAGALSVVTDDATPAREETPASQIAIAEMLEEAEEAFDRGDLRTAEDHYFEVLKLEPTNAKARMGLKELAEETTSSARVAGFIPDQVIRLAVQLPELVEKKPSAKEAFVFSRLAAGPLCVRDLVKLCPFEENEVLDVLLRASKEGIIQLD